MTIANTRCRVCWPRSWPSIFGIAIRTAWKMRASASVICPETRQPAGVHVDIGHAVTTAVLGEARRPAHGVLALARARRL
jgi:hypothetical protein